jgi:hypothetical protein
MKIEITHHVDRIGIGNMVNRIVSSIKFFVVLFATRLVIDMHKGVNNWQGVRYSVRVFSSLCSVVVITVRLC